MEHTQKKKRKIFFILAGAVAGLVILAVLLWLLLPKPKRASISQNSDTVYAQGTEFAAQQGLYFQNAIGRMEFLDFETGRQVPLCGKANCGHTEQEDCDAYITISDQGHDYFLKSFLVYRDHLYLFCSDSMVTVLVQADLDGGNRKKLVQLEYSSPLGIYASHGKLFFTCQWIDMEAGSFSGTGSNGSVIVEFDLESGQWKTIVNSEKSDDTFAWIGGTDGTTLYYAINPTTDNEETKQKCGLYRYQIADGTSEKIADSDKLNEWGSFCMRGDFLYYGKEQPDGTSQVIELELLKNQERIIAQHEGKAELRGPYGALLNLLFVTDGEKRETLQQWDYDLDTNQKLEPSWPEETVKSVAIYRAAPEGYIVSVLSPENNIYEAYMTKEDYYKRAPNFMRYDRSKP